jgi:cyclase
LYLELSSLFSVKNKENSGKKYSLYFILCFSVVLYALTYYSGDVNAQDSIKSKFNKTQLTNNLYLLQGPTANVLLSSGKDGVLLVDDEMVPVTENLKMVITEITDKPIKFVINTHHHADHTEGNIKLGEEGAIIIAHENVRKRLSTPQYTEFDNTTTPAYPEKGLPIITFSNNMKLHFNDDEIKIIHIKNGHTDGDSIVYFTKDNVIHVGDLFSDAERPYIDINSNAKIDDLIKSLQEIAPLINNNTIIVGGHHGESNITKFKNYTKMVNDYRNVANQGIEMGMSLDDILTSPISKNLTKIWNPEFPIHSYITSENLTKFAYQTSNKTIE